MSHKRSHGILAIIVFLVAITLVMIPMTAMASTNVDCVQIKASSSSSSSTKFKINKSVKAGDVVSFYIKPHSTDGKVRFRENSDTEFATAAWGDGITTASMGDGWYAVRFTVNKYKEDGTTTSGYSASSFQVYLKTGMSSGKTILIREFAINGSKVSNSTLKGYIKADSPSASISATTASVSSGAVSYTWPTLTADNFYPYGNYTGTVPSYSNQSMYKWTVNTAKGGATNLPAVVLAATGQYKNLTNVNSTLLSAMKTTKFVDPNNMIFFISDGFGPNDLLMTEQFTGNIIMNDLPYHGTSVTVSFAKPGDGDGNIITDSAAGGTALATGYKTRYGYECLDKNGKSIPQITELLRQKKGKLIGVVTNTSAYDATPAVFAGAHSTRSDSDTIASQMISFSPDLWIGYNIKSSESAVKKQVSAESGLKYFSSWSAITGSYDKVWVNLAAKVNYNDALSTSQPTTSMMMAFSLTFLQKRSVAKNNAGFFLMYESSLTDDAGHKNNYIQKMGETRASSEAMAVALKFACENPDTIVIHTADHDCGGLTLASGWKTDPNKVKFTTSNHSTQPVDVFAIGKGTNVFNGQALINAQVGKLAGYLMGITFGSTESTYSIDAILAGATQEVTVDIDDTDPFVDKWLHITANSSVSSMSWTFPGYALKAYDNCTFDIRVPAGATSMTVYGVTSSGSTETIKSYTLDKFSNYNSTFDYYAMHFKPENAYTGIKFKVSGSMASGATIEMDNLVINATTTNFSNFNLSNVTADSSCTAWITASSTPTATPKPTATPTPKPTATPAGYLLYQDFTTMPAVSTSAGTTTLGTWSVAYSSSMSAYHAELVHSVNSSGDGFLKANVTSGRYTVELYLGVKGSTASSTLSFLVWLPSDTTIDRLEKIMVGDTQILGQTTLTAGAWNTIRTSAFGTAAGAVKIEFHNKGGAAGAKLYIDDVKVTGGSSASATATPKPTATPTPKPTATPTPKPTATPTPKPTATPTPAGHYAVISATKTNSHPWIQFVANKSVSAGTTVSIRFKPMGTLDAISVRSADANTKIVTVTGSASSGYTAKAASSSYASSVSLKKDSSGWYTLSFKSVKAQSDGLFFRFEVGEYSSSNSNSAAIAIDDYKVGSYTCSFNSSNITSNETNKVSLKMDDGTAFKITRKSQYYWKLKIV